MRDMAVVVSVAGERQYFEFASYFIPSFLKNNPTTDLLVFTDNVREIRKISEEPEIIDLEECFAKHPDALKELEEKGCSDKDMEDRTRRYGFLHHHIFVSALLPISEWQLRDNGKYSHILKVDIDGYFAGGDMISLLKGDIRRTEHIDLYLVERKHVLMELYGGGVPGVGFTLWRIGGEFIPEYLKSFHRNEQGTILRLRFRIRTMILSRPGYHFVRPFWQAKKTDRKFTKEQAEQFLPAYFHVHGIGAIENLKKLESWFSDV